MKKQNDIEEKPDCKYATQTSDKVVCLAKILPCELVKEHGECKIQKGVSKE